VSARQLMALSVLLIWLFFIWRAYAENDDHERCTLPRIFSAIMSGSFYTVVSMACLYGLTILIFTILGVPLD